MLKKYFKVIFKFLFAPFLGKTWGQNFFALLYFFSLKGMNFGGGANWSESGEKWVVKYFAKIFVKNSHKVIFFDVGANVGGYSMDVSGQMNSLGVGYDIYSFEPSKHTFGLLKARTVADNNIHCFNLALGEAPGKLKLYSDDDASGLASLYKRDADVIGREMDKVEEVEVESLISFCEKNKITKIDFLKMDVEGNEYKILKGAQTWLNEKKINFIQFEFGGADIDSRVYFRDFFKLLSPNYNIYRILKNGLQPIRRYRELDEIFITTNYLAVLK